MTKRFIAILLTLLCVTSVGCADDNITDTPSDTSAAAVEAEASFPMYGSISVAVLGDSIARGYGLESVETERFSALLENDLHGYFENVTVTNHGVDGMTGAELAALLESGKLSGLGHSDYVLVSVGGNNILRPLYAMEGFNDILYGLSPAVLSDYFCYLFPPSGRDKSEFEHSLTSLSRFFESVERTFSSERFEEIVSNAALELEREIPEIIGGIKKIAPDAKIVLQTVYNPYDDLNITLSYVEGSMNLSKYGEMAVSGLNRVILSLSSEYGYSVADVHSAFSESASTLTNAGFDLGKSFFNVDPHPNALGHTVISRVYLDCILEHIKEDG